MRVTEVDFNKLVQQLYQCGSVEAKVLYIKQIVHKGGQSTKE
jgi:hypothetical protein